MSGLFGLVTKVDCTDTLLYGTDYHSHLGSQFGGVAVLGDYFQRMIHNISQSQFKSKFYEDLHGLRGNSGIGVISPLEEQPIYLNSKFGPFCLAMDGVVNNTRELAVGMLERGITFSEVGDEFVNSAELVAKIIAQGIDLVDGIDKMFTMIDGSCSLLVLSRDGVYAARDLFGYSPLAVGSSGEGWAVTSETSAFKNTGFTVSKYLEPGEIVLIGRDGPVQKRAGGVTDQICAFLWIYTGFPTSDYEGINVEAVRERCGRFIARRDTDIEVDVVSGIPDSGIAHAIGYAIESGKPYRRPLVKYTPGYGRSYIPPSQEIRDHIAKMKLVPNTSIIENNRIIVCEDSIVRGTQLKNYTVRKLWEGGAREVHVRPACPPLMYPCRFNLSTRSIGELAARRAIRALEGHDIDDVSEYVDHRTEKYRRMVDWIAEDLCVTTLRYQTLDDMVEAIGQPREKLCLYCWNGEYRQRSAGRKADKAKAGEPAGKTARGD